MRNQGEPGVPPPLAGEGDHAKHGGGGRRPAHAWRSKGLVLAFALTAATLLLPVPSPALSPIRPPAQPAAYVDLGRLISSKEYRYGYAYGPTIVVEGGVSHMFYCSYGRRGIWDYVRYATSADGRTWSSPVVALEGTDPEGERAACDPSVVRFRAPGDERPFWYMFYSGNAAGVQTAMFVARAERIGGPYEKWTKRQTWEADAPDPAIIIGPTRPTPDKSGFYGAGQQSVIVEGDRLVSWYSDDTTCAVSCFKQFRSATRDPTAWPRGEATNLDGAQSVDVKRTSTGYLMVAVDAPHQASSTLTLRRSRDGLAWSAPETVCGTACLDPYAHNAGIAGDAAGSIAAGPALVVYGAPADRNRACGSCWARWDLFGGVVTVAVP